MFLTIAPSENFNSIRQEAVEFVRQTNEEPSFNDVNYVFPLFVIQNMPTGLVGLIVAAILAAAMSSVAAELNSLSTATTIDFYARHVNPQGTDRELLRFARLHFHIRTSVPVSFDQVCWRKPYRPPRLDYSWPWFVDQTDAYSRA